MINSLIKLANHLDSMGCTKEVDRIDYLIKLSQDQELLEGGGGPILEEWEEILRKQERELQYPAPTYSEISGGKRIVKEIYIDQCPFLKEDARSSRSGEPKGLVSWNIIAIEIDAGESIYVPVTSPGGGVLDIYINVTHAGGSRKKDLQVVPEKGVLRIKDRTRAMGRAGSSSEWFSIGKVNELSTSPIRSGFTVTNISDEHIRLPIGGTCLPKECAGKECIEWLVTDPPRKPKEKIEDAGPQAKSELKSQPPTKSESEPKDVPSGWKGEVFPHQDGPEGHPKKWRDGMITLYEDLYPGDAVDEIILPNDHGEWI